MSKQMPLEGLRVLELGNFVAAPFAGKILAEFGAEVIKVEEPTKGDQLRGWRKQINGTSLWWYVQGRNKKSITLNLRDPEGQAMIKKLIPKMDVVLENFKPGVLEKWGLGYEDLKKINPSIVMARISGYGQTGPYRNKAGFGSVAESIGGLRHLTGFPDRPPARVGIAIGDLVSGMYAVIGILMALHARDKLKGEGQLVDVALYESVFSLLEEALPEYYVTGKERERAGTTLPGVAPTNSYLCKDGKYLIIGGNGDRIFQRFMKVIGRPDLAEDPRFANNQGRVEHSKFLDEVIENWTKQHTVEEAKKILDEASVPCGPIYGMKDIVEDEHYYARDMIKEVEVDDGQKLLVPGIVPKLSETPGDILWNGPKLGEFNEEIYKKYLGLSDEELSSLKERGVI